jgi:hypothetical protein
MISLSPYYDMPGSSPTPVLAGLGDDESGSEYDTDDEMCEQGEVGGEGEKSWAEDIVCFLK